MAKKIAETTEEVVVTEETTNVSSERPSNGAFRSREKQIEFARKRAQRQASEMMRFLQNDRMNYEKTSFINKAHIIFQNLPQINDVNVLVGDNFVKNISKELNGIIYLEANIRTKINSRQNSDEIKKAIEQLEKTEKLKIEIADKLKEIHQELKSSLA